MPPKAHSSIRLSKRNGSNTNLVGGFTTIPRQFSDQALSKRQLSGDGSQTNLVITKSKVSLHKKRPSHLTRKDSTNSNKPNLSVYRKKSNGNAQVPRQMKKGAFRGALDGDVEDEEDEAEIDIFLEPTPTLHPDAHITLNGGKVGQDEEWVSEPSTRCATPTAGQVPPSEPPVTNPPDTETQTLDHINLAFQLPNPLSPNFEKQLPLLTPQPETLPSHNPSNGRQSPQSSQEIIQHRQDSPPQSAPMKLSDHEEPETVGRGRSRSRNRLRDSIERVQRLERSRASNENGSVGVIDGSRRQVVEGNHRPTRSGRDEQPAQRSNSPPLSISSSATTTTPRCEAKGKGRAQMNSSKRVSTGATSIHSCRSIASLVNFNHDHPSTKQGLNRVDSTASLVLQPKVDPTEAFVTLTSKNKYNITSLTPIEDLTPSSTHIAEWQVAREATNSDLSAVTETITSQAGSSSSIAVPSNGSTQPLNRSGTMSGTLTSAEKIEFANRLKKLTNTSETAPPRLMSSLLSPRISFKLKKQPSSVGSTVGYFGTIKSFVGSLSTTAEELETSTSATTPVAHTKNPSNGFTSTLGSTSHPNLTHGSHTTTVIDSTSSNRNPGSVVNPVRHLNLHFHLTNATQTPPPKPLVKHLITTCGSVPVVSRFLGPVLPTPAPTVTPTSIMGGSRIGGTASKPSQDETPQTQAHPPTIPTPTRRTTSDTFSVSRIQQRLLRERDRPIEPTPTSTHLPPPSFLIRSLGGQTGPLPFMPLGPAPGPVAGGQLNEPAMKAKTAVSMRMWQSCLIDEVEQVWTDHESNVRWRDPWAESLSRVTRKRRPRVTS